MIKNAVIAKANIKVKEDEQIAYELEIRKNAKGGVDKRFHDNVAIRFNSLPDLPVQLRPQLKGLSDDQLKVYQDFSKLSFKSKFDQVSMNMLPGQEGAESEATTSGE